MEKGGRGESTGPAPLEKGGNSMLKKTTIVLATLSLALVAGCGSSGNNQAANTTNTAGNTAK
jgi:preprotein translocase subunit SecG